MSRNRPVGAVRRRRLRPSARPCLHLRRRGDLVRRRSPSASACWRPFGRGDKATVGYCVRLSRTPPPRAVKRTARCPRRRSAADRRPAALTRWMADYYLCGWGQVLNAVVPAGAREQGRHARRAFLEAVPEAELAHPAAEADRETNSRFRTTAGRGRADRDARIWRSSPTLRPGPVRGARQQGRRPARSAARRTVRGQHATRAPAGRTAVVLNDDQDKSGQHWNRRCWRAALTPFCCTASPAAARRRSTCAPSKKWCEQGKEALVLVPEISLTPQTIHASRAAAARWPCCTAIWATPSAAAIGGASRRGRSMSSSAPQRRLRPDAQARTDRHRRGTRNDASSRNRRRATMPAMWP